MNLREIGWEVVDCIHLAQDTDHWKAGVKMMMKLRLPYRVGNFFTSYVTISF